MTHSMIVHNVMEDIVHDLIDKIVAEPDQLSSEQDYCFCPKCRLDITAIALNQLPPKYIVTQKGEALVRAQQFDTQSEVDVLRGIIAAIDIVSKNPQHT